MPPIKILHSIETSEYSEENFRDSSLVFQIWVWVEYGTTFHVVSMDSFGGTDFQIILNVPMYPFITSLEKKDLAHLFQTLLWHFLGFGYLLDTKRKGRQTLVFLDASFLIYPSTLILNSCLYLFFTFFRYLR